MHEDQLLEGAPNCPVDLIPMDAEGDGERARWRCPECGFASLSA